MLHIRRVELDSAALVGGLVYGLLFTVIGFFQLLFYVLSPDARMTLPIYYNPPDSPERMELIFAALNYLIGIILAASSGALAGGVFALAYNFIARRFGGLKLRVE